MTEPGWEDLSSEERRHVEQLEAGEVELPTEGKLRRLRVRQPLEKVVPIRMSDEHWRILSREAEELGLRPTTLMRMWVLERLREAERGHRGTMATPSPQPASKDPVPVGDRA
jgi:hypothetical protein